LDTAVMAPAMRPSTAPPATREYRKFLLDACRWGVMARRVSSQAYLQGIHKCRTASHCPSQSCMRR
jgi:hypothetical protein